MIYESLAQIFYVCPSALPTKCNAFAYIWTAAMANMWKLENIFACDFNKRVETIFTLLKYSIG